MIIAVATVKAPKGEALRVCSSLALSSTGGHQDFAEVLCRDQEQLYQSSIFFSWALSYVKGLVKIGKSKSKGRLKVEWNYCYGLHGFSLWGMLIKEENVGFVLFYTSRVSLSSSMLLSLVEKNRAHLPEFGIFSSDTAKSFLAPNEQWSLFIRRVWLSKCLRWHLLSWTDLKQRDLAPSGSF